MGKELNDKDFVEFLLNLYNGNKKELVSFTDFVDFVLQEEFSDTVFLTLLKHHDFFYKYIAERDFNIITSTLEYIEEDLDEIKQNLRVLEISVE